MKNSRSKSRNKRNRRTPSTVVSGYQRYPAPIRLPPNRTILWQFRNLITITSSGGGIVSGMIPCDPSATLAAPFAAGALFNEWTSVATLFSAIKCVQLECIFRSSSSDEVKGDASIGIAMATNLTSIANFATSYLATMDNADSQVYNPVLDTAAKGAYHALKHRPSLNWGGTSTPASSAAVYAGAVGGIGIYGSTAVTLQVMTVQVIGTYLLSQRS